MNALLAFPVALPLAGAAFIALTDDSTPEELKDIPAMLVAAATTTISTIILIRSERVTLVHWFGGWQPRHGLAIGIGFVHPTYQISQLRFAGSDRLAHCRRGLRRVLAEQIVQHVRAGLPDLVDIGRQQVGATE